MTRTDNLPTALRKDGLFCCWRYEQRGNKTTKVPYNPRTDVKAKSTDPGTFAPLTVAEMVQDHYDGLGVGIFGALGAIDIDHCISEAGEISEAAVDIMQTMDAYTEYSPSGHGLRILFTAAGFQYDKARYYINNQKAGIEVYIAGCTNKFVTVTGAAITPGMDLIERGDRLAAVLDRYMVRPKRPTEAPPAPPVDALDIEDAELIARAKRSRNGAAFAELWAGALKGYNSHSEADIALCNMLAFWTNRDAARMDKLFRQSGLMREKWDRPQSGSTYGAITIQNAIETAHGGYDPQAHFKRKADKVTAPDGRKLADLRPEQNERYRWSDIGNGKLFADWYKDQARYVPERKKWFVYNGEMWEPDVGNLKVMELCKQLADDLAIYALSIEDERQRKDYMEYVAKWQRRNFRETILKDAASAFPVKLEEFDRDPLLFNCQNGTLDLMTMSFKPHDPADMLATVSGVNYVPAARSRLWEQVIEDVTEGDKEKALFLQKAMGYGLTGDTSEECFFILFGATTRNGKGTVMETYMKLMGGYGRAARPETIAQKDKANSTAPTEDIARLAGARVVNISEPGKSLVLSAAMVKTMTGNDRINARFLNENSFEFYPQFKLFINTNHLPKITDVTVFSSGRVKVIVFGRHFTEKEQDKSLKRKLGTATDLSGILNWCLDGLRQLRETGLDAPASVLEATAQYQLDSDKVSRFISEAMAPDPREEIRTEDAYKAFQQWCYKNGQQPESFPRFRESISAHVEIKRKRPNGAGRSGNPVSAICGMRLCVPVCADVS